MTTAEQSAARRWITRARRRLHATWSHDAATLDEYAEARAGLARTTGRVTS